MIAKLLMAITMALAAMGAPATSADVVQVGDHYLVVEPDGVLAMWEEANGHPGLQAAPVVVLGRTMVEPDTRTQL